MARQWQCQAHCYSFIRRKIFGIVLKFISHIILSQNSCKEFSYKYFRPLHDSVAFAGAISAPNSANT